MKSVVFDIDGTRTETNRVDGEAFLATVRAAVLPIQASQRGNGFTWLRISR